MSDHRFKQAGADLAEHLTGGNCPSSDSDLVGSEAIVAGTVTTIRRLSTRQGKTFAAFGLEDLGGSAELTLWPDGYERYREILVEGNVLMARVSVRQRTDRVTYAVEELCAYHLDTGALVGFDPARFLGAKSRRRTEPALAASRGGAPEVPAAGGPTVGRGHLRLLPSQMPRRQRPRCRSAGPRRQSALGACRSSPTRTTISPRFRRRVRKIVAVLASAPGPCSRGAARAHSRRRGATTASQLGDALRGCGPAHPGPARRPRHGP
ncbi:MAG: OB-fold nucleic acid binding domain-containing protein [Dehalococcoidia bacterium]